MVEYPEANELIKMKERIMARAKKKTDKKGFSLRKIISILLFLMVAAYFSVPGFGHIVRYYGLELQDKVLEMTGMAPHYDNLMLGAPRGQEHKITRVFNREGYALGYSEGYEQPLWVTYRLTADELTGPRCRRTDDFREDPRILTRSADPDDYKGTGCDRGHLAPAADMAWNEKVMSESFYMSNMSPQIASVNRGIWNELEQAVRDLAKQEQELFIVTGPIFEEGKDIRTIGVKNKVAVPHAYYKVVYDMTPPERMMAFIVPNYDTSKKVTDCIVTVRKVEKETGLTFFPELPEEKAETLKNMPRTNWVIKKSAFRKH